MAQRDLVMAQRDLVMAPREVVMAPRDLVMALRDLAMAPARGSNRCRCSDTYGVQSAAVVDSRAALLTNRFYPP